jgi:hypothetical protein
MGNSEIQRILFGIGITISPAMISSYKFFHRRI